MRKLFVFLLSGVLLAIIYIVLRSAFPKSASLVPAFLILLLFDGYLWWSVRKKVNQWKPILKYTVATLFWLPLVLLVSSMIGGIFSPFIYWNIPVRTYMLGIILVAYTAKLLPSVFHLIADLIRLFQYGISSFQHGSTAGFGYHQRNKYLVGAGWILGIGFFLLFVYGMVFGIYQFQVRSEKIALPELPGSFNGFRIVQISDVHLGSWSSAAELRKAVNIVNSLKPDLILFTGDMVNYCSTDLDHFAPILRELHAREGIYSILGNHDYGDYVSWATPQAKQEDHQELLDFYRSLGWHLLLNENSVVVRGQDSIAILGAQNWGVISRFQRVADMNKTLKGVEHFKVQILLTHDPSHWHNVIVKKFNSIDITFCGHTHGFQFGWKHSGSSGARLNIPIRNGEDSIQNLREDNTRNIYMLTGALEL